MFQSKEQKRKQIACQPNEWITWRGSIEHYEYQHHVGLGIKGDDEEWTRGKQEEEFKEKVFEDTHGHTDTHSW